MTFQASSPSTSLPRFASSSLSSPATALERDTLTGRPALSTTAKEQVASKPIPLSSDTHTPFPHRPQDLRAIHHQHLDVPRDFMSPDSEGIRCGPRQSRPDVGGGLLEDPVVGGGTVCECRNWLIRSVQCTAVSVPECSAMSLPDRSTRHARPDPVPLDVSSTG
jgi:hypothetical protein